jgi:hypothetical protein
MCWRVSARNVALAAEGSNLAHDNHADQAFGAESQPE